MDWSTILLVVLMGGVLYFLMIRPQQKRQKEQQSAMSALQPGSRVMLISGILATVKYLGDKQAVVEISPGVEMTIDKRAISPQPVTDEFEYADDDAEATPVEAAGISGATAVEPAATTVSLPEPPVEPATAEDADRTWENPGTTRN